MTANERTTALLLMSALFFIGAASTVGRTAADTLFLSHYGASQLSLMYLPQAICLLTAGYLYQWVSGKANPVILIRWVIPAIFILTFCSWMLSGDGGRWLYPIVYIAFDVFNFIVLALFWQFAPLIIDQRKAKKMVALTGGGAIAGAIAAGFGLKLLAPLIGTANLFLVYSALQAFCFVILLVIIRRNATPIDAPTAISSPAPTAGRQRTDRRKAAELFRHAPHLPYVMIITTTIVLSLTLIDFQFKVLLQNNMREEEMAAFMGSFHAIAGLLAIIVQFGLAPRLLGKLGVTASLLTLPVALIAGSVGLLFFPILPIAVYLKGSDKVIGDTLYASANQLIMFPISPEWRARAKALLDGIVRNGAKAGAALCVIALAGLPGLAYFSAIVLVLLAVCLYAGIRLRGAYTETLLRSLQTHRLEQGELELNLVDPASTKILTQALLDDDPHYALGALRFLRQLDRFDLAPYIPRLLRHASTAVRAETLRCMQQQPLPESSLLLSDVLSDPAKEVRAEALLALAAYGEETYMERIAECLQDRHVQVQAAAIAGLIRYYGLDGMFRSIDTLKQLLDSEREADRLAMAELFGKLNIAEFCKPLLPLLNDPSPRVRIQALTSASIVRVPALAPHIVPLLAEAATQQAAVEALSTYPFDVVLPLLEPYWSDSAIAPRLPRIWAALKPPDVCKQLLDRYETAEHSLKDEILEALLQLDRDGVKAAVELTEKQAANEADKFTYWRQAEVQLPAELIDDAAAARHEPIELVVSPPLALVGEAIAHEREQAARRMFQWLGLLIGPQVAAMIHSNWQHGNVQKQANAAETLQQLLAGAIRQKISVTLEPTASLAAPVRTPQRLDRLLEQAFVHGEAWLRHMIALFAANSNVEQYPLTAKQSDSLLSPKQLDRMRTLVRQTSLLKKSSLFAALSQQQLGELAHRMLPVTATAGTEIIRKGDSGDSLYIVESGKAVIRNTEHIVWEFKEGDCFGEMAVLDEGERTATVMALTDCKLWTLDSAAFYSVAFKHKDIALRLMQMLSKRLRTELLNSAARTAQTSSAPAAAAVSTIGEFDVSVQMAAGGLLLQRMLVLQKIGLFGALAQHDIMRLAALVEEADYGAGEVVVREGEEGDGMYALIEGKIEVRKGGNVLAVLQAGECFGEMALIDQEPRSADCATTVPSRLLYIRRETVIDFCFERPEILRGIMQVLSLRLRKLQQQTG